MKRKDKIILSVIILGFIIFLVSGIYLLNSSPDCEYISNQTSDPSALEDCINSRYPAEERPF